MQMYTYEPISMSSLDTFRCAEVITTATYYMNASQTVSTSGIFTGLASGMWAEWQVRDLSLFTPASAPVLGYANLEVSGNTTEPSNAKSTSRATSSQRLSHAPPQSLSAGAKGAVGASVGVALVCLVGAAMWWVRKKVVRRKQTSGDEINEKSCHELDPNADILEAPEYCKPPEADSRPKYGGSDQPVIGLEKDGLNEPVELDGDWHGHEIADTSEPSDKDDARQFRSSSIVETPVQFLVSPFKF